LFVIDLVILLKTAGVFLLGMGAGFYFRIERITIREYERGLLFKNGSFKKELGPGRYNIGFGEKVNIIDVRQENYFVQQNILTSDNIHIGINITLRTRVADAYKAFTSSMNFQQDTHDLARSVIKETGHKNKTKTILKNESLFEQRLKTRLEPKLKAIGMELVNIEVIDAQLPRNLQESIAEDLGDLTKKRNEKKKKVGF
jgi:regulator of protease activity HflC (stomatin/prohibitin superfamily)